MNITDTLFAELDVTVEPFAVCDVRRGFHLNLSADKFSSIHYVLAGTGRLTSAGIDPIDLHENQMILIPGGLTHRIESSNQQHHPVGGESICLQPSESLDWLTAGEGTTDIVLACGRIHATYGRDADIFGLLDFPLAESFNASDSIRGVFETILQEFCSHQLGMIAMTSTLMKQCLILLLRRLHEQQDERIPWLALLENRGLQNALKAILESPEKNYRVEDLADLAHMSRSAFSEQFTRYLGNSPHEFLNNYRLKRAAQLLKTTDKSVELIADQVGFQSRSSFSRAFKSVYGCDPASFRKLAMTD